LKNKDGKNMGQGEIRTGEMPEPHTTIQSSCKLQRKKMGTPEEKTKWQNCKDKKLYISEDFYCAPRGAEEKPLWGGRGKEGEFDAGPQQEGGEAGDEEGRKKTGLEENMDDKSLFQIKHTAQTGTHPRTQGGEGKGNAHGKTNRGKGKKEGRKGRIGSAVYAASPRKQERNRADGRQARTPT